MKIVKMDFNSSSEDGVVTNMIQYEQNGGKFNTTSVSIDSKLMFINVGRSALSVLAAFTYLADTLIKYVIPNEITMYVDGMAIVYKTNNCRHQSIIPTCIVTETLFDAKQWLHYYRQTYPSMKVCIFDKNKVQSVEESNVVIATRTDKLFLLDKYFFQRIVLYTFDTFIYKTIGKRCNFMYSFNQYYIIHYSQQLQTFQLVGSREPKIKFLAFEMSSKNQKFNFISFVFPTVERRDQDDFKCPVCLEEKESVLRTKCNHNVCSLCLQSTYRLSAMTTCSLCRSELYNTNIVEVYRDEVKELKDLQYYINKLLDKPGKKIFYDCERQSKNDFNKHLEYMQKGTQSNFFSSHTARLPSMFCDLSCVDFAVVILTQPATKEFVTFAKSVFKKIYVLTFKNMYTENF